MAKLKTPTAPPADNMKRHNVFMPPEHIAGLNTIAQAKGGTAADHLRKAVAGYLKRYKII